MRNENESSQVSAVSLPQGVRYVRFEYPTSIVFATIRRQSRVILTASLTDRLLYGVWYSFLALLLGPWGVPWGIYWTAHSVWVNLTGGVDVTGDELYEAVQRFRS